MDGFHVEDIDPVCCISLFLSRDNSCRSIHQMKAVITVVIETKDLALPGLLSGAPSSMLDPLRCPLELLQKFQNDVMSLDHAKEKKSTQEMWIGIIDGCHYHSVIMELREKRPNALPSLQMESDSCKV